jgi:hypothetical protein
MGDEKMKRELLIGLGVFLGTKWLIALRVHWPLLNAVFLWWLLSLVFRKHVPNPMHLAQQYRKRIWRFAVHKQLRLPVLGGATAVMVSMPFPVFLIILALLYSWAFLHRKEEEHVKGNYPQLGRRFTRGFPSIWQRTTDKVRQHVRFVVVLVTVCGTILLRGVEPLRTYYQRRRDESARADLRRNGDGEDDVREGEGQTTD